MNEWEWIELLRRRVMAADGLVGIGDDAAVIPFGGERLLVTTDTFVEGLHFNASWATWSRIGRKMAEAAISDIAAMGGEPVAMVAGLSASPVLAENGAPGILEGLIASGVPLVGGDTTGAAAGSLTVTITVLGRAARPVLRSGAKPGDRLWISGAVGGSAAGLLSLQKNLGLSACEARFLDPRARRDLACAWGSAASSLIDISDGFSAECHHLATASSVRIVVDESALPLWPGISAAGDPLSLALGSGEEFELLATSAEPLPGGVCVGTVESGSGVTRQDGSPLLRAGWTHWT